MQQGHLLVASTLLMLLIIVPVIALTLWFAWRYRQSNTQATYTPDWDHSIQLELVIWAAPLVIILALGALTWIGTHTLDPYRPIRRIDPGRPVPNGAYRLTVDVVALDWKWLFMYPGHAVGAVNELVLPVDVPVRFRITSDTVMNSFFVPAMAGQIYAMPGMETRLHAVINKPGTYEGFSANYSGAGFSHMRFKMRAVPPAEFEQWLQATKSGGGELTRDAFLKLAQPSAGEAVRRFGAVVPDLYDAIVNRCVAPGKMCMRQMMAIDAAGGGIAAARNPELLASASMCTTADPYAATTIAAKD